MRVYAWNSYSCNNSSSYRLVGRFATAKQAEKFAKELETFFKTYGPEFDDYVEKHDWDYRVVPPSAEAFAKKYGMKWKGILTWGDEGLKWGTPDVMTSGSTLVVYHDYCGGFGETVPKILKKAGAKKIVHDRDNPGVTVTMKLKKGKAGEKVAAALSAWFSQGEDHDDVDAWGASPWDGEEIYASADETAWYSDGETFEFHLPMKLRDVDGLIAWLRKSSSDYDLKLCADAEHKRIRKLQDKAARAPKAPSADASTLPIEGCTVVFTGKLATMTRAEAKERAEGLGAKVTSSVTKALDYLVIGDEGSPLYGEGVKGSKMKAAEKLIAAGSGVQIISENTFLQIGGKKKKAAKKAAPKKPAKKAANKAAPKKAAKKAAPKKASSGKKATVGKKFCFTGKLASMTRGEAKSRVKDLGGKAASSVTKDLDFLVIGDEGSPLYGEGKKGSKMVAAEKLQASGAELQIISETDFLKLKKK